MQNKLLQQITNMIFMKKTSCGQSKLNEKPKYILRSRCVCFKFVFTYTSLLAFDFILRCSFMQKVYSVRKTFSLQCDYCLQWVLEFTCSPRHALLSLCLFKFRKFVARTFGYYRTISDLTFSSSNKYYA